MVKGVSQKTRLPEAPDDFSNGAFSKCQILEPAQI
jgi:hypothetical protein